MYLIDTNVVSALRRTDKADPRVLAWAAATPAAATYLSAISLLELEMGVQLVERRDDAQGRVLRNWLEEQVLTQFDGRVLAVDAAVARRCASLHVPDRRAERDALIAATALTHRMTVVTRNTEDFEPTGATLLNPWLWAG